MTTFTPDTDNKMFQLAIQLVNQSNRNIFLTGKAGTGKTTFLKYIRNHCPKQMAVVAPTGVAAINAGGVTIHSFFQLPLEPFFPEPNTRHQLISRLRFNSEKKKILQELEILVIDEISMVRCDILDAIDTVLRHVRQRNQMFGGVQLLFIGDMLQLPPVVKDQEWNQLTEYYSGHYFFDSLVLKEEPPIYIEFNKIYRQSDERFINVLNQVRNNELNKEGLAILESRFQPSFRRNKKDGYIILTTHNNKANSINIEELADINNKIYSYQAEVVEEFSERAFPADELLQLKEGAQVMFIRNDSAENGKRFFNGKIGTVGRLDDEKIFVQCEDEPYEIEVQKEKWENIRYTLDKSTRKLDSEVLGSFTQFPLRLAWAITIHKSQGLTFEKAIIDAGEAFAPGQVYVALSRCTNLEGMVLQSRVRPNSLFSDQRIVEFSQRSATSGQLEMELVIAKKQYQQTILKSTFDFTIQIASIKELFEYLIEHKSSFNDEAISWTEEIISKLYSLQETTAKFQTQLQWLFQEAEIPEENKPLQERIVAASKYFIAELSSLIQFISQSPTITDSRQNAKEYNEALRETFAQLSMKKFMLEGFSIRFDMEAFHQRKQKFVLPSFTVNAYAGVNQQRSDIPHPVLHQQLRKVRELICTKKDVPIYIVAGSKTIDEMAEYLPQTLTELKKISGFGDVKIKQYGQQFLDVIVAYAEANSLMSLIHQKSIKKEPKEKTGPIKKKGDTYAETYKLYKEGKSIAEIAEARNLTSGTIETHLSKFVSSGEIKIGELITREKLLIIESAVKEHEGGSITSIKQKVGNDISFGEIRLVMAGLGIN